MTLGVVGIVRNFWVVIGMIVVWGLLFAASMPIRQTYLNGLIPSRQRATVLSFDSMVTSSGGVVAQPALGRAADVWGYAPSYLIGAGISALAVPFLVLSRRQNAPADTIEVPGVQATDTRS
jgi:MFS family permease